MTTRLSVSEARRRLPAVLRAVESRPDRIFEIHRRGKVIARLVSSTASTREGNPWSTLIALGSVLRKRGSQSNVSERVDEHLTGIASGKRP